MRLPEHRRNPVSLNASHLCAELTCQDPSKPTELPLIKKKLKKKKKKEKRERYKIIKKNSQQRTEIKHNDQHGFFFS
jgi:hypothetical protein